MIAKIMKGSDFKGVVYYILNDEKGTQIIDADGLFLENNDTIAQGFRRDRHRSGTDESEGDKGCRAYRIELLKGGCATAEQCGHGSDSP